MPVDKQLTRFDSFQKFTRNYREGKNQELALPDGKKSEE